jgi:hypothetical protein
MLAMTEAADDMWGRRLRLDRPTPARMYDYYLDGKDNFEVDRSAAEAIYAKMGYDPKYAAVENRRFLWRVVEYLARDCGIAQFIDVGSGLPAARNTHEVAQEVNPDARVVYVDNDPIVLSHGRALLTKNGNAAVVTADVRNPAGIFEAPETRALIDFSKPVAVLFVALFHFVTTPAHHRHVSGDPTPGEIVAAFSERVVPGSYLVITHVTTEGAPPERVKIMEDAYEDATSPMIFRPLDEIEEMFAGWRLVPPGVVRPWEWPVTAVDSPHTPYFLAGVAVKDHPAR